MRIFEIQGRPEAKLDLENKVYIVYDENGKEYSRHEFQHVWDSSPAKRAAGQDVKILYDRAAEDKRKIAANAPLNGYEKEYIKLDTENKNYYQLLFPVKGAGHNPNFSKDQIQRIEQEMEKNHERMMSLQNPSLNRIRSSVILGTYKPPQ